MKNIVSVFPGNYVLIMKTGRENIVQKSQRNKQNILER